MINIINYWLVFYGVNSKISIYLANLTAIIGILIISLLIDIITKKLLLKALKIYVFKSKNKWADILIEKKVFGRLAHIAPMLVINAFAPLFPHYQSLIQRFAFIYMIIIVLLAFDKLLEAINLIYRDYEISKIKPIKGYLQIIKILSYVIVSILVVSILMERSPWILLSGIGAAAAVILLVFQNSLLGFVASIQLSENNMLHIGDWIEMPAYGANGDVVDISLHTVKVQNWDNTITTIPTHVLISESFKNYRRMQESGGRRIMRSIYIDITSIQFCTEEMLAEFKEIDFIKEYLEHKEKEIESYNRINEIDTSNAVNGRCLTNIGVFRAYVEHYLRNHPKIHPEMIQMVRQLQPTENGLPIEIYVFTNCTAWVNYEAIQADIFDHILAVIPEFYLRVYQSPTGYDLKNISRDN